PACLLLFVALSACGQSGSTGGASACATATISRSASVASPEALPTALHVVRTSDRVETPTIEDCVGAAAAVQQLYAAARALPVQPPGFVNCPKSSGLVYHLTFLHVGIPLPPAHQMALAGDGCGFLTIGASDVRQTDRTFRSLFATTLGIPPF